MNFRGKKRGLAIGKAHLSGRMSVTPKLLAEMSLGMGSLQLPGMWEMSSGDGSSSLCEA